MATVNRLPISKVPSSLSIIEIDLVDGRKGIFGRENANSDWKYDGSPRTLQKAQKTAGFLGDFLEKAADGKVTVKRRLFKFKLDGDIYKVQIADASRMNAAGKIPKADFESHDIKLSGIKKES